MFSTYLQLGFEHISDLEGYDHILFIAALCAVYSIQQWKEVLILVTAFTVGHSITLALAALKIFVLPVEIVEFLIPVTILLTCVYNVFNKEQTVTKLRLNYGIAAGFGLIHGIGFSNFFRSLLGTEGDITMPLLAFNIGLEVGQIIIVLFILILNFILLTGFNVKQREWNLFLSGAAAGIAFIMMTERVFW